MRVVFGPEVFGQRYGGISRYFVEVHRRLPALGVRSTIAAGGHQNLLLTGLSGVRGLRLPRGLGQGRPLRLTDRLNRGLAGAYLRATRPTAIYHQTYYQGRTGIRHTGPLVVTAYDLIHAKFAEQFPSDDPTVAQQRRILGHADLVLAISHRTKLDICDIYGIAESKIVVTHLGVSPPSPDPAGHAPQGVRPFLLYVGPRGGYKNWGRLVEAFAESGASADFDLLSVGGGPLTDDEVGLLSRLGLVGAVRQLSADDNQLDSLYKQAVGFLYPSVYEGFGLPPLEAMIRGCPVVASSGGSMPEVLGDAAILVDPLDVESLSRGLLDVLRPDTRHTCIMRGRRRAAQYSWDRTAAETVAAYSGLGM